jgi:hypothetical protein
MRAIPVQWDITHGTMAVFSYYAGRLIMVFLILLVIILTVEKKYNIGILLDRT